MNGAPSASDQVFTVNEDHTPGTLIGTIQASDPDDDPLTFMITAGNADIIFDLEINTGNIFLANDRNLDFESSESYELAIDISDGKDMISIKISINVNDIIENRPPNIEDQSFSVKETAM